MAKIWCYFGADGRICADSMFQSEDDCWRVMLGWPTLGEVLHARQRGDQVRQIEISVPDSSEKHP